MAPYSVKVPWTEKPPLGVGIDRNNPLLDDIWWVFNFSQIGAVDLVRGVTEGTYDVNTHRHGEGAHFPRGSGSGDGSHIDLGIDRTNVEHFSENGGDPFTILSFFQFETGLNNQEFPIAAGVATGAGQGSLTWPWTADQLPHTTAAVFNPALSGIGDEGIFYFDGVERASVDLSNITSIDEIQFRFDHKVGGSGEEWDCGWYDHGTGNHHIGGTPQKDADCWRGLIFLQLYWRRALTSEELASLHENPWRIFEPQIVPVFKPSGAAGPIAATEAVIFGESATIFGRGIITATEAVVFGEDGTIFGRGVLTATEAVVFGESATIFGRGVLTATEPVVFGESATIFGRGILSATEPVIFGETGTIFGRGILTATEPVILGETANLTDANIAGPIAATEAVVFGESATIFGRGILTATEAVTFGESATIFGRGVLTATEPVLFGESSTIFGRGILTATEAVLFGEAATIFGRGIITATEAVLFGELGTIFGRGIIAATEPVIFGEDATIIDANAGVGAITATEAVVFGESVTLFGRGVLTATEPVVFNEDGTILGRGVLSATESVVFGEDGTLFGRGILTATEPIVFSELANLIMRGDTLIATEAVIFGETANLSQVITLTLAGLQQQIKDLEALLFTDIILP